MTKEPLESWVSKTSRKRCNVGRDGQLCILSLIEDSESRFDGVMVKEGIGRIGHF